MRVLSPSAMHSSLEPIVKAHRQQSGVEVRLSFETAPMLTVRLAAGAAADVIIQNYTAYIAALAVDPPNLEGARAFLRFLGCPAAKALFAANGVE